jgi:predicted dinucleotide-binding enzyme
MGQALASGLSKEHEVRLGSRDAAKARAAAAKMPGVGGDSDGAVAEWCDAAVLSVPFAAVGALKGFSDALAGKLVVSIVNPLRREGDLLQYASEGVSAAELVAKSLPRSSVATAFNNVPPAFLRKPPKEGLSVLVAADTRETYGKTAELVRCFPRMVPLYVGPLSMAGSVERLTVLVLNAAALDGKARFSPKFVSD